MIKRRCCNLIVVKEIPRNTEVTKPFCPYCKKPLTNVGLMRGSKAIGITTVCKRCGRLFEITTT